MRTLEAIDLFLFDLDGLLVDTEMLHWKAYRSMCEIFGCRLDWEYSAYLQLAGGSSDGIQRRLHQELPQLFSGRTWEELYAVKKQKFLELLASSAIPLMPGVQECLPRLARLQKPMVVVTHSPKAVVERVRTAHSVFSSITHWISREMYDAPKPAPDGYIAACLGQRVPPERAVGFEDSVRGVDSLLAAGVYPVLVNACDRTAQSYCRRKGVCVMSSLSEVALRKPLGS